MHKIYKVITPCATTETWMPEAHMLQKSNCHRSWHWKPMRRIQRWTVPSQSNTNPAPKFDIIQLDSPFWTKVSVRPSMGKTLQGLLSDQWAHHCKHHGLSYPAGSLSVVSLPSCPICYCLISSAKEPLPCQLSVPSVLHKMAAAQQPNTALLPGTRLPSLPQSANTGSRCWQSQDFITTTLTSAGLFVISLLSWFWLYNHLPLIRFASVLLLTDFILHINLPLACYCICSLLYY